jgi:hypothetical protein
MPKTEAEKPKFFKLKLRGTLPGKPVSRFWDFQVQLKGDALTILEGLDLGFASKKKPMGKGGFKKPFDKNRHLSGEGEKRPFTPGQSPIPRPSRPKPVSEN